MTMRTVVWRGVLAAIAAFVGLVLLGLSRTQGEGGDPPAPVQWRRVR